MNVNSNSTSEVNDLRRIPSSFEYG